MMRAPPRRGADPGATSPPPELVEAVLGDGGASGDMSAALALADSAEECADLELRAAALDRAYGLNPSDERVAALRERVLDRLQIEARGMHFRYVPAGTFLMGSRDGDPDEQPVHAVRTSGFWMSETPVTWREHCRMLGWARPPYGHPRFAPGDLVNPELQTPLGRLQAANELRRKYCRAESPTPQGCITNGRRGVCWDTLPMVAVSWQEAEEAARAPCGADDLYALPSEAEWEKAARGGLISKRYAWGDYTPGPSRCDFGRVISARPRSPFDFPANGYGLRGMCGGVWEWTSDFYDAQAYSADRLPLSEGPQCERVVRGGSFTDSAAAVTVSFRWSLPSRHWRDFEAVGATPLTPNVGYRLVIRRLGSEGPG